MKIISFADTLLKARARIQSSSSEPTHWDTSVPMALRADGILHALEEEQEEQCCNGALWRLLPRIRWWQTNTLMQPLWLHACWY